MFTWSDVQLICSGPIRGIGGDLCKNDCSKVNNSFLSFDGSADKSALASL